MTTSRNYDAIPAPAPNGRDRVSAMTDLVRALWHALSTTDVSWVGVYVAPSERTPEGAVANADEMLLAVREPKPACSPIGLHGACGRAALTKRTLLIHDIRALDEDYIACDPKDLSELVLPLLNGDGSCWGVLDLDSFSRGAFDERDANELHRLLLQAGLTQGDLPPIDVIGNPAGT